MIYKKLTYEFLLIRNVIPNKPTYLIIVTLIFEWLVTITHLTLIIMLIVTIYSFG